MSTVLAGKCVCALPLQLCICLGLTAAWQCLLVNLSIAVLAACELFLVVLAAELCLIKSFIWFTLHACIACVHCHDNDS